MVENRVMRDKEILERLLRDCDNAIRDMDNVLIWVKDIKREVGLLLKGIE